LFGKDKTLYLKLWSSDSILINKTINLNKYMDTVMIDTAVILAAGSGTRLKPLTDSAPKCLTEVNGTPILINMLQNLIDIGMRSCTIVTGYLYHVITDLIGTQYKTLKVDYIVNSRFKTTNDMYSLWLARKKIEKGVLIIEGDIFFRAETLTRAFSSMGQKSYYVAGKYDGRENEILIKTDKKYLIKSVEVLRNRRGDEGTRYFMSSGILLVQAEYGKKLSQWLSEYVECQEVQVLFDDVISAHTKDCSLYVFKIDHREWVEIDTKEDLKKAELTFL